MADLVNKTDFTASTSDFTLNASKHINNIKIN